MPPKGDSNGRSLTLVARIGAPARPASDYWIPAALLALLVACARLSRGYYEADELSHFLMARTVWTDWRFLVDIWGRLGCTALYAPLAPLGLTAARLLAVVVSAAMAVGMGILARRLAEPAPGAPERPSFTRRHAVALAWLLLFAQPEFLKNSFTVMTELLLACTWVWAAVALVCRRTVPGRGVLVAGFILGLGALMRPEGWIAIACWPFLCALWLRREMPAGGRAGAVWRWAGAVALAGVPTFAWYLLGVLAYRDGLWFASHWPWQVKSPYGPTGAALVLALLVSQAGWMWAPLACGAVAVLRGRATARAWEARWLLLAPVAGFIAMHAAFGVFGLFGSMSMTRYFLCIAPLTALLAVLGLDALEQRCRARWGPRAGGIMAALAVAAALGTPACLLVMGDVPAPKNGETRRLDLAVAEVRRLLPEDQWEKLVIIGHPYLVMQLGLATNAAAYARGSSRQAMRAAPPGTVLVTDSQLWFYEGRPLPEELAAWGYHKDEDFARRVDALTIQMGETPEQVPGRVRIWRK